MKWTIHDGKFDEFKALAQEAADLVASNEPDMLGYNWYLDASGKECTLIEQYPNTEHILTRLGNVGGALGKLLEASDTAIDGFGAIRADARAALDPLGAVYHEQILGFSRY